ncbi:MAG: hypothetical protein ABH881_03730 [bacterium]
MNAIFSFIFPAIIICFIGYVIYRFFKGFRKEGNDSFWQVAFSKEDFVSQVFYLFALCFFGVAVYGFNRDMGDALEWQTIVLSLSLLGFAGAYFLKSFYTLPTAIIGMNVWWAGKVIDWTGEGMAIFSGLMLLAVLFYALGLAHRKEIKFKRYSLTYIFLGIIGITGGLFFLSTRAGLKALEEMSASGFVLSSWQATTALALFLILIAISLWYGYDKNIVLVEEVVAIIICAVLFTILLFLPEIHIFEESYQYNFTNIGIIWALFFNVLVFVEIMGLIMLGYFSKEIWMVNMGAFFLFLLVIVKYFDWFFDFFDKSIFFISAGILLFLAGGFMEKGRRYMLKEIKRT